MLIPARDTIITVLGEVYCGPAWHGQPSSKRSTASMLAREIREPWWPAATRDLSETAWP
jgi:hypothetical protein